MARREAAVRRRRSSSASGRGRGGPRRRGRLDARAPTGSRPTTPELRSATATRPRWARSTCCRPGVDRAGARAWARARWGPDALDPALTLEVWRERIRQAPGRAQEPAAQPGVRGRDRQRVLGRDPARRPPPAVPQAVVAGAPRRSTSCTRRCGRRWPTSIELLRQRVPPTFEKQVRDHLAVHNRGGEPCPRCGTRITEVTAGGFVDRRIAGAASADARRRAVGASASDLRRPCSRLARVGDAVEPLQRP